MNMTHVQVQSLKMLQITILLQTLQQPNNPHPSLIVQLNQLSQSNQSQTLITSTTVLLHLHTLQIRHPWK